MSRANSSGEGTKTTPRQLAVSAGKYGGVITAVLLICQFLGEILVQP